MGKKDGSERKEGGVGTKKRGKEHDSWMNATEAPTLLVFSLEAFAIVIRLGVTGSGTTTSGSHDVPTKVIAMCWKDRIQC